MPMILATLCDDLMFERRAADVVDHDTPRFLVEVHGGI
jgi:hypothetical protein